MWSDCHCMSVRQFKNPKALQIITLIGQFNVVDCMERVTVCWHVHAAQSGQRGNETTFPPVWNARA